MRMRVPAAVALVLVLSACTGANGGGAPDDPPASTVSPTEPSASGPSGPNLPGEPANGDLTGFGCKRDADGTWSARGTLTSPSGASDYRVTVVVAPAGTDRTKGRRAVVSNVRKGKPKDFEVSDVPADADGGNCRVQVVRLD